MLERDGRVDLGRLVVGGFGGWLSVGGNGLSFGEDGLSLCGVSESSMVA